MTLSLSVVEIDCTANPATSYEITDVNADNPCVCAEIILHELEFTAADYLKARLWTGGSVLDTTADYRSSNTYEISGSTVAELRDHMIFGNTFSNSLRHTCVTRMIGMGYGNFPTVSGQHISYGNDTARLRAAIGWRTAETVEDRITLFSANGATMNNGKITVLLWYSDAVDIVDFSSVSGGRFDFDITGAARVFAAFAIPGSLNREYWWQLGQTVGAAPDTGNNYGFWGWASSNLNDVNGENTNRIFFGDTNQDTYNVSMIVGANAPVPTQAMMVTRGENNNPNLYVYQGYHYQAAIQNQLSFQAAFGNSPSGSMPSGKMLVAR